MKLSGVHHVSLNVHDADVSLRFYTESLGLEQIDRPDFGFPGSWLQSGATQVHLIEVKDFQPPQGQHFAFRVDDLEFALEQLREKGVSLEGRAGSFEAGQIIDIPGYGRQAFFFDPTGNMIELNEPKDPS